MSELAKRAYALKDLISPLPTEIRKKLGRYYEVFTLHNGKDDSALDEMDRLFTGLGEHYVLVEKLCSLDLARDPCGDGLVLRLYDDPSVGLTPLTEIKIVNWEK